jgi:chromosomal replication initiator protein
MFVSDFNSLAYKFADNYNYKTSPAIVVITGPKGTGKTALLKKIFAKTEKQINNIIYLDAGKFASKYAYAAQNGLLTAFRRSMRSSDLFLLDNINTLKGKIKTIEELFYTWENILVRGGKIIATYQGVKSAFDYLGPRFASRLKSGLIIPLNEPSTKEIDDFCRFYLGRKNKADVWDNMLIQRITHGEKNLHKVIELLDIWIENPSGYHEFHMRDISRMTEFFLSQICLELGVEEKKVLGKSKSKTAVQARYLTFLLLNEIGGYSYQEIARCFDKNLSNLINGCQKIRESEKEIFETLYHKLYNQLYQVKE